MRKKRIVRLLILLLFSPCMAGILYWTAMDLVMAQAVCDIFEEWHDPGVKFLTKHGDEFTSYHMIYYIRNMPGSYMNEGHDDVAVALAKKYPREKEYYLAVTVSSILNTKTTYNNRIYLTGLLEKLTGEKFGYPRAGYNYDYEIPSDELLQSEKAMRGIADWWAERQRARAGESIKALRKNNKRKPRE